MRLIVKILLVGYIFCLSWYTWLDLSHELLHYIHNPIHHHEHTHYHYVHDHDSIKKIQKESVDHDKNSDTLPVFACFLFFEKAESIQIRLVIELGHNETAVLNFQSREFPPLTPPPLTV